MKKLTKTCLICGKVFEKKSTTSLKDWNEVTKFCSYKCCGESKKKYYICKHCGTKFHRPSIGSDTFTFCSQKCFGKDQSKKRTYPRRPCKVCGKPVNRARAKYCSVECRNKGYRGEEVYNYVGEDFCKEAYPVEYTFWKKIAEKIRTRDKVCQHCGKTPTENGRALDVHHIEPYRISRDNSPDNLVSLCRSCHKKADRNNDY